jgi:Ca-activated chloride channel family protein
MSFQSPGLLLGLLVVPLALAAHLLAQRRRQRYPVRFPAVDTLAAVLPEAPGRRRHVPVALFALALAGLALALARPELTVAVPVERASVVLVTDVSRSMQATDVSPSRLAAARAAAERFLDSAPDELRVGLVSYSEAAHTLQTPTTAHDDVRAALQQLRTVSATATGAGLRTALASLDSSAGENESRPPSAIVLLSDGSATDGDAAFAAAEEARRLAIPIYTVALGSDDGEVQLPDGRWLPVPPDPQALERIAAISGGDPFEAQDADQLDAVSSVWARRSAAGRSRGR